MLRYQLRNIVFSPAMPAAILGLYVIMLISLFFVQHGPSDDLIRNVEELVGVGYGGVFVPILSVLPFCAFLKQGCAGNERVFSLTRSRLSRFTVSTVLSGMLTGMVVTFCGIALYVLSCLLVGSPYGPMRLGLGTLENIGGPNPELFDFWMGFAGRELWLLLLMCADYTAVGAFYPLLSLLCFSFTQNKYVVAAAPFLIRTALAYLGFVTGWWLIDPGQLDLMPGNYASWLPLGGIPYMLGYIGVAALLCGTVWAVKTSRGIRKA